MSRDERPDVIVIGGGIIGTATAATLAAVGLKVTLLEQGDSVAPAASGRNAGSLFHPPEPVLGSLFRESLDRYRELDGERLGPEEVFHVPPSPGGVLALAFDGDLVRRVGRSIALAQPELEPEVIEGDRLLRLEPVLAPGLTAVRLLTGYPVRPSAAARAFASVAARHGAAIRTGISARPWISAGRVAGVETDTGRLEAAWVVVAAGPWTPDLVDPRGVWRPIRRSWGVIVEVHLAHPPSHVLEELRDEATLTLAGPAGGQAGTARPAPDGSPALPAPQLMLNPGVERTGSGPAPIALGGTLAPDEPDPAQVAPTLVSHARTFLPSIGDGRMGTARVCARPQSVDGRPLIGFVPGIERLVVVAGNGGWGISTGPATARLAADAVMSGTDRHVPDELRADRFGGPRR